MAAITTRCWLEIDLQAIAANARAITERAGEERQWCAVVKADAYGHGAAPVAKRTLANGAGMLAVASVEEALELRAAGISQEILNLGQCPPPAVPIASEADITLTVFDLPTLNTIVKAMPAGVRLRVHLKFDSGMGRMGFLAEDAPTIFQAIRANPGLAVDGIYTHFAVAAEDHAFTARQVEQFERIIQLASANGLTIPQIHSANSAGFLSGGPQLGNWLRAGIALYGLEPTPAAPLSAQFRPALSWKTVIAQVKQLPAGHSVGYGRTYITNCPQRIAILAVGYSDGYRRAPGSAEYALVRGRRCPLVGRISMEKTAIRLPDDLDVAAGEEVVLLGRQGNEQISAELMARWWGTINYEVVTAISARVPRRYSG